MVATERVAMAVVLATSMIVGACTSDPGEQECAAAATDVAPPPIILSPIPERLDVKGSNLRIEVSAPMNREHLATEISLWRVAGGERVNEVWNAMLTEPGNLVSATLSDGTFISVAEMNGLLKWKDYAIRARHQLKALECPQSNGSATHCCPEWSEWSTERLFRVDDGSTAVFDPTQTINVAFEIPAESYAAINAEALPPGCVPYSRSYQQAAVVVDGERFDNIGLRVKGGCGSARTLDAKSSFKANLSWNNPSVAGCPEQRRFRGLKRLTLNNMVQDQSFTHESLAYYYYALMGVAVPRSAYVRVAVNGEPWGLYLNLESIDRRMLSRHFQSNQGMLYEGTYWCDFIPANIPANLDDSFCIQRKFSDDECSSTDPGADPTTYQPIRDLADDLAAIPEGAFYPAVTELIDWDAYLSLWAADAMLSHWDGYSYNIINNYRVYHNLDKDRWQIIPTGVDQTFVRDLDPFAPRSQLATRCLAEPACEATFIARLSKAVDIFESADLEAVRTQLVDHIRAEVATDPRKEGGEGAFDSHQDALRTFIANRPANVRNYITNHQSQ